MKKFLYTVGMVSALGAFSLTPFSATAAPASWGQEVKTCNATTDCYPGDGSRGSYVQGRANDGQGPGYAMEIHSLAKPGGSDPSLP